jgi:acetyl esterase
LPINYQLLRTEVADYLKQLSNLPQPLLSEITPLELRKTISENAKRFQSCTYPIHAVTNEFITSTLGKLLLRIYSPSRNNAPVFVYYHGGGWVAGSVETHDNICRFIAMTTDCIVVSVDYALAPENKYHSIVMQCYEALLWVAQHAQQFNADSNRIMVGGDSAGANLAAAMTLIAKEKLFPNIALQLLICPATDLANFATESYQQSSQYGLTREKMQWFVQQYLSSSAEAKQPLASPLLAADLSKLPTAIVVTAEYDVLRDEGKHYADRLARANVATTYCCMKQMIHSGVFWAAASDTLLPDIKEICSLIKNHMQ